MDKEDRNAFLGLISTAVIVGFGFTLGVTLAVMAGFGLVKLIAFIPVNPLNLGGLL